ncbi:MAG: hypothetical protein ABJ275_12310 [Maricaulaceae bacterium]
MSNCAKGNTNYIAKTCYLAFAMLFVGSCDLVQSDTRKVNSVRELYVNSPSKLTTYILETRPDFCSEEHRHVKRWGKLDVLLDQKDIFRDLTVDAICLDGLKHGDDGYESALKVALFAHTYDLNFEYENLLYLTIATSYKATEAEVAWAYDVFDRKGLEMVIDGRTGRPFAGIHPRGSVLWLREKYLSLTHVSDEG